MSPPEDLPERYYAVIFSSQHGRDDTDYAETASAMSALAAEQPGFLGYESALGRDGFAVTVSYWRTREHIAAWREQIDHAAARARGRAQWYESYRLRVALVERDLAWSREA